MKKLKLISIIVFSIFVFIISSSFVLAETRDFYFPITERYDNPFKKFISDIGLKNIFLPIKTKASQMTSQGDLKELRDGGGGAEDLTWVLDFPTKNVYLFDNISDLDLKKEVCSSKESDWCFSPRGNKQVFHPWRVQKVEVHTTAVDDDEFTDNCRTNAFITSPTTDCYVAFNNNTQIFGSSNSVCRNTPLEAYLYEGSFPNAPAGRACGHVRLDGGALFDTTFWRGYLKATAKSPEFDDFGIKGEDANTGQLRIVKSGGLLEICNGETIEVFWETKDVQKVFIIYGNVEASFANYSPGEPKEESLVGSRMVKPLEDTNFSIVVQGATGDGIKYIYDGPVEVSLKKDCQEEIVHCDKINDLENETNPFCVDKYPEYGSRKKCCNWPENEGEFGDGCGICEGTTPPPSGEISVDLKVGNSDGPVTIDYNDTIQLFWTSLNTENCSIFSPTGFIVEDGPVLGDVFVPNITSNRTFTLRCFQGDQFKDDLVDVFVDIPEDQSYIDLKANNSDGPITIDYNSSVNLTWTSQNVSNCFVGDDWSPDEPGRGRPSQGQETISNITSNKIFTISCDDNKGGIVSDSVIVNVEGVPEQTFIDLKANGSNGPIIINYNSSVNLTWTSQNVSNCLASGLWKGSKSESGSEVVSGVVSRGFFTITCKDEDGKDVRDRVPVVIRQTKGNIGVFIRLDGEIINASNVSYNISGPQSFSGSGQETFNDVETGTYVISYIDGLPPNSFDETIEFSGYSPARTLLLGSNQTINFYLDFETLSTCNLTAKAELASCGTDDFQPWSGVMTYSISGPINLNGTFAPQEFNDIPEGNYFLNILSGPGILNSIIPSNPINCSGGSSEEIIARFEDCEDGPGGYRYSCNLQSQRCEICTGSVDECPFATLSECRSSCGGGAGCGDEANIICWTNFDSENCIGLIDGDSNPNVVLTNNLAGCSNISSCQWEIINRPQYTQNSCSPFSWYDEPGRYTAIFTAIDQNGATLSDTQDFEVRDIEGVECSFAWSPQSISVNTPTDFFDRSISRKGTNIISWYWAFTGADISTSTNQIVQNVIFGSPGNKSVTIEVENDAGNTCSLTQTINVRRIVPDWIEVIPQ